jgi:hypothetical protein
MKFINLFFVVVFGFMMLSAGFMDFVDGSEVTTETRVLAVTFALIIFYWAYSIYKK